MKLFLKAYGWIGDLKHFEISKGAFCTQRDDGSFPLGGRFVFPLK